MNRKEIMSNEKYKDEWISKEVNLWKNKKMKDFDERKKRKLLSQNLLRIQAINKFINGSLFKIINKSYKNGAQNFLTPAEKLDYLQKLCVNTFLRNNDIIKAIEEELVKTHVSGVSNDT